MKASKGRRKIQNFDSKVRKKIEIPKPITITENNSQVEKTNKYFKQQNKNFKTNRLKMESIFKHIFIHFFDFDFYYFLIWFLHI